MIQLLADLVYSLSDHITSWGGKKTLLNLPGVSPSLCEYFDLHLSSSGVGDKFSL